MLQLDAFADAVAQQRQHSRPEDARAQHHDLLESLRLAQVHKIDERRQAVDRELRREEQHARGREREQPRDRRIAHERRKIRDERQVQQHKEAGRKRKAIGGRHTLPAQQTAALRGQEHAQEH
ncbi:MAG: hypothetical protein MR570_03645, partial [Bifidobacterium pseudolongum]|nr:hypothetical protein [Bifidobacterium pseudolongum]